MPLTTGGPGRQSKGKYKQCEHFSWFILAALSIAVPITAEAQYPSGLQSNFVGLGIKPMVNTYMANAVAAMPFGRDGRWADIGRLVEQCSTARLADL